MLKKAQIIRRVRKLGMLIDAHTHVGADMAWYANGDFPYSQSAEDLLVRMDAWEVGAAVCFPFLYTSYFNLKAFRAGRFVRDAGSSCACPYAFLVPVLSESILTPALWATMA